MTYTIDRDYGSVTLYFEGGGSGNEWWILEESKKAPIFTDVKTGAYTAKSYEFVLVDLVTAGSDTTITLPSLSAVSDNALIGVKMTTHASGSQINVDAAGSDTIDGLASVALTTDHESVMIQAKSGTGWFRVG